MSKLLQYMRDNNTPADNYYENQGQSEEEQQEQQENSGGLLDGIVQGVKKALTPTVIAPDYTPRALDDSVYTDIPGTPTEGAFGALEDEGVRQERMDNSAQWAADNIPHAYAGMIGGVEGLANVVGGIRNAAGGEDSDWILRNAEKAEKSIANIRKNWDDQYGDNSYIFNPNGLANDIGNGIGSSLPIMGLSLLAPEAAVGLGTRAATSALSRIGLGRLAASKAGQALIGDVMRSPLSTAGDTMAEYGSIVYDLKQSGMSDEEAREKAKAIIPRNIALDTLTIPGELYIMKGAKGIGRRRILSTSDDSLQKRIAKGAARAGLLSPASAITEGYQEGAQNALEDNVKGERDTNWFNPFSWNDEDLKAARAGAVGAAFMGAPGNFMKGFSKTLQPINKSESWGNGGLDIAEEQINPAADNLNGMMDFNGTGTATGVFSPQEIVNGVASRNAETIDSDLNNSPTFLADDTTETGVKSPADIIAGVQQRAAHAAENSGSSQNVFSTAAGTTTGIASPDEIIAGVQQRQQEAAGVEQQKAVISQYLDDNTVDQMGGEDNYNWLMGVIRSGTPEEVQQAYDTVVASTAETRRQEEAANARQAAAAFHSNASADTAVRTGNPNVDAVIQAANDQHFDANVALAVAAVESGGGDVNEIHMAGHDGMFQIEPETAQNYGVADKYPNWQTDPYENAMAGIEVLKAKIAEKGGDLWSGVEHYNGGGDVDYLAKVQAAYETTGNAGSTASSGGGAVYDGIRLTLPDSDAFTDESGNVDGLTEDTRMKLRVLDNLCYQKFGQHLIVSSSYREGDSGNHGAGVAFDVSGGIVDDPEARKWLEQAGPAVGLFVIPEYQGEAGAEFAHGDNVHFSNVEPGIYGQTRDAEGHWSEDHAAPSIQSILNGSNGHASSSIDLNTNLESNAFENALHQWEDVTIPDTAEALKNTAGEGKDADLFDTMFTVDDTGKEHFQDTQENREAVKQQYGQQVRDAAITAMVKHLLQEPSVQQNTTITKQLSQAVKKGDTAAMTQIAHQWFDMKTPNLERERSQAGMVQPVSQPIGGMPYETSRRTSQNQTNGTEAVPNQNVNTVPRQSQEAGTFRENSDSPAAPDETNVTAEAVRERASMEQPIIGHTSLVPRDDSITAVKNHTAPAMLPEQAQNVRLNGAGSVQPQTAMTGDTRNTPTIFADTMQQGRPVIYKGEVAEEDSNTEAVKKLQDTLYHKGEAVFKVDDFEAEKQKRGPEYTMQDYAKEWLARKAPGVKQDTAAYQALEKTVAQHMEAAYNLTQNGTKKAADNGGVKLADGYRTESGRPLSEADKDEFIIKPDGSKDFGYISKQVEEKTQGKVKALPIRLQVGFNRVQDGKNFGFGLRHIKRREIPIQKLGYHSVETYVEQIANNFDRIYDVGNGRIILVMHNDKYNVMPVDLEMCHDNDNYYTIVTAIPKKLKREAKEKGTLIFNRSASLLPATNDESVQNGERSKNVGAASQRAAEKSKVPSSPSIIAKEAEKGNTTNGLRAQLSEEEKQVYDYAVQKLSQGNDQVAKAAKESAFLYARMAERWTEIMHEYGDTTYTPKNYMEQHPIVIGDKKVNTKIAAHSARSLSHNAQGQTSQNETAISLTSIQKELENVNEKYEQRAWHGSGMDFDTFDLGKIGTGSGAAMHGWGIYTAKNKRTAQKYKKLMKEKGLPSFLYEVDIPENKNLLDENKRYKEQMKGMKEKIVNAVEDLSREQQETFWKNWLWQKMGSTKEEIQAHTNLRELERTIQYCKKAGMDFKESGKAIPAFRKRAALDHLEKAGYTKEQINDPAYMEAESKRHEKALAALQKKAADEKQKREDIKRKRLEDAMADPQNELEKSVGTGKELYDCLTKALSDGKNIKETSTYLNDHGIYGITYEDASDGRCYVVFDDKAISIIDKYNQHLNGVQAAYDTDTGAIHLFDTANASSFIHESAHMFLSDMERLAGQDGAPKKLLYDLKRLQEWAAYETGKEREYEGTHLAKEFAGYAHAIQKARKGGDAVAVKAAEERWLQERFARGFERYLAEGKAPNMSLKRVFAKFKEWLTAVYQDLKKMGKQPPKEIQDIMVQMITPQEKRRYAARKAGDNKETPRALQDIKDEIQDALPNAKNVTEDGNRLILTMPNDSRFVVDIQNQIALTAEQLAQAKKDHHIQGDVVVEGYTRQFGKDAYMALAQGSRTGTGYHEVYHAAEDAVLTDKEKAAITKAIPDAEKRADQYAKWVEARKRGRGTAWGKLFQKIKDFAKKVQAILTRTENAHHVFRKVESGEVWTREAQNTYESNASVTNSRITGKTRVPITDVTKWEKVDLTNSEKKKDIAESLNGASFDFSGDGNTGRFANKSDSKHFVNSSNPIQIHLKTRQKAFSNIGQILNNAIYIEKHPDARHGKRGEYLELFSAVRDGKKLILFKIIAKEGAQFAGRYTIGDVKFYDILQQKKGIPHHLPHKDRQNGGIPFNTVSVADLLAGVNDRQGRLYVNSDGTLNYEFGVLKTLPEGKTSYSIRKPKTASEKEAERSERKDDEPITIHTILDEARKIVPIYTRSKVQRSSRAAYRYDAHGRAGFVPSNYTVGDIGAAVALHIDHAAQLKGANVELTNDVLDELETEQRAAKKYKQEPPKDMTPAEARREGVKEFGRIYFQNPDRAKERYPKYFDIFEKTLDTMPKEKKAVENIMELEEQMAAQNPLLLATAGISQAADKKPRNAKERLKHAWAQFYRAMVDETSPIDQITKSIEMELGRKLADEKDPHKRAVMCNSVADGRASMLLFADNKDANLAYLNTVYKGAIQYKVTFEDVLNELKKVRQDDVAKAAAKDAEQYLGMYLVAQRTEEIVKTHEDYVRPEGYNHENCMRIIANAPETIKKAAQLYWDYNKNLVNILEKEGLITKEQAAGLRKYEKYCPMYRDFSADSTMDNELPTITAGRGFINQSSGLKKLKGGSILAVVNPVDSMVHMTSALIARCERNDVAKVMVQAAEDYPGLGRIIVKDPSLSSADASKCAFSVMVNGRKTIYRTTPELYQALQDMSTNSAAFLTNVFGKFTDALRFGATNTPSFMVRNFIRDTISATVNARYGHFIPIVDSVRGMAALKKNADFKAKFYGQGVPMDTYIRSDIRGAKQYKDKVRQSLKHYPMGIRQMMAFARFLVHTYNGVGEALEQGTRAGAMLHALKDGASDFEAGQEARDVTVNFSRHGSLGKKINRYVPFFNASIQGTDKLIRTFMENPKRASLATCIYIILPTIILWAINHDDDWYKELDDSTKYTNWVLHIPGTDHHWLIPKPQEVGIGFGSGVEAALNQMLDKDPHAMKEWARQFTEAVTPGIIATVLRPIMEWRYNYSEWTGRKLVPDRLSKLPPEQQYTTATSELAKLMSEFGGKYADLSPIAIDNFFSGWFGSLGRLGASVLNTPISKLRGNDRPPEPAKYWYEAPFVGSFARQDGQNSVYVERFYQLAHDMEIDYERSDSYAKNKGKKGAPLPASLRDARTCMKTLSKINKDIRSIKDDPKMDPESKRQKIDAANTKMRSFAKKFVTQYDK